MAITIEQAKKIGDKKLRAIKSSDLVAEIKTSLAKFSAKDAFATPADVYGDISKRVVDNAKMTALFATNDKTCIHNGKINVLKVLKIRLNDMVYNSRNNEEQRTMRIYDEATKTHKYALAVANNVHEKVAAKSK